MEAFSKSTAPNGLLHDNNVTQPAVPCNPISLQLQYCIDSLEEEVISENFILIFTVILVMETPLYFRYNYSIKSLYDTLI